MELTPREKDKLLIFMVALLADRRIAAQGVKLNCPEAVAYLSAALLEGACDALGNRPSSAPSRPWSQRAECSPQRRWAPDASIPGTGRWHADLVLRGPPEVTA